MANFGSKKDEALVIGLARGLSIRTAAEEAGIGKRTAYRRMTDPEFRRRVSTVRGELMDRATGRLAQAATEAADVLQDLLTADADSTRLAAARAILQQAAVLREAGELEDRITRLEEESHESNQNTPRVA